jgi:hypothetical protein
MVAASVAAHGAQRLSALGDENTKIVGDAFEVFVEGYLATHQKMQAETVWLVGQVPQGVRRQAHGGARPAGHCREPGRRRFRNRHPRGGESCARRLHHPDGNDGRGRAGHSRLRHHQGLRANRTDRVDPDHCPSKSGGAGEFAERYRRYGQKDARRVSLGKQAPFAPLSSLLQSVPQAPIPRCKYTWGARFQSSDSSGF